MVPVLRREKDNAMISGVCAGLGSHLGVPASLIRGIALVLLFTSAAPVVAAYLIAAWAVPEGPSPRPPRLTLAWGADGLRARWWDRITPYSVAHRTWLGGVAGLGLLGLGLLGTVAAMELLLGASLPAGARELLLLAASQLWPLVALIALIARLPRPYTLTVTHDAVWLERPLRRAERIPLSEVEALHCTSSETVLLLKSGEARHLPPPPEGGEADWASVREQLAEGRRRAGEHGRELQAHAGDRERLAQVLRSREGA